MAVRVLCPNVHCGAAFEVAEGEVGTSGHCPECDTGFILGDSALAETVAYETRGATPGEIPTPFGRYEIVRKLGQGGMGAVYLARDTQLDRPVALKVPLASLRDNLEVEQRFRREARAAARFHHPNFCPIYEVGESSGWPYLAMAYIEGETLAAMIARERALPLRRAAAIARKLAQALQEAHDRGVVHRDLKPSNVMINGRRELIVMDFGLARREGADDPDLTRPGVLMGSPHYMAPEQVRAEQGSIGASTDIYALGVILYEMIAGRRPFTGATTLVLGLIATSHPARPSKYRPDLDPELEGICLKAMARDPADRYPSMRALAGALEGYLKRRWPADRNPVGGGPGASWLGRIPDIDDIKLVPEPEPAPGPAPRATAAVDAETGSAYHLAVGAEAAAPDDPWGMPATKPAPRHARPPVRPRHAPRPRSRLWLKLRDASYVALCLLGLVVVGVVIARWTTTTRGTIQIQAPGPRAVVRIDGRVISTEELKLPIELPTGEHDLLVTVDDRVIASQKVRIAIGSNPDLRIRPGSRSPRPR